MGVSLGALLDGRQLWGCYRVLRCLHILIWPYTHYLNINGMKIAGPEGRDRSNVCSFSVLVCPVLYPHPMWREVAPMFWPAWAWQWGSPTNEGLGPQKSHAFWVGGTEGLARSWPGGSSSATVTVPAQPFGSFLKSGNWGILGTSKCTFSFEEIDIRRDSFLPSLSMEVPVPKRTDTQDF